MSRVEGWKCDVCGKVELAKTSFAREAPLPKGWYAVSRSSGTTHPEMEIKQGFVCSLACLNKWGEIEEDIAAEGPH